MWCELLADGKAKYIERYTDPLTGKSHRVSVTLAKDTAKYRKEAQTVLSEKIQKAINPAASGKHTLSDLKKLYIAEQSKTMKESTWRRNDRVLDRVFDILGSDILIDQITAGYIRSKFLASGKSASTLNGYRVRLKAFIRWCYLNDYMENTSCVDKLQKFKEDETAKEKLADKYMEKDELARLIDGMMVPRWAAVTKVMALSGMRIGELIALNKSDVIFSKHIIRVNKTYDYVNSVLENGAKTAASNREIYMQPELEKAMQDLKQIQHDFLVKSGAHPNNILFLSEPNGDYMQYSTYNKYLRENGQRILGRDKITTHVLRHTHVALLAENGVPLDEISARIGHSDSSVTRDVYFHVTKRLEDRRRERMKQIVIL